MQLSSNQAQQPGAANGGPAPLPAEVKLRDSLRLHEHGSEADESYVVLEDTENRKFFRLGPQEVRFVKNLMSNPSVPAALALSGTESADGFHERRAAKFCEWLDKNGLLVGEENAQNNDAPFSLLAKVFYVKIPLVDPDEFLTGLNKRCGWLFSWQTTIIGLVVAAVGVAIALINYTEFMASYQDLFTSWRSAWLVVGWVLLKIIHETGHAATCKRYGGDVREAGAAMIVLMPIAYVDVSSCWRFRSKWARLHVTLAGVAAELGVAGLAMIVWASVDNMLIRHAAADIFLLASVTSLLFNLNPLLKFDGYFALADVAQIDNLYQFGQSYAKYFGGRYFLGLDEEPPRLPDRYTNWIKVYGVASAAWRVVTVSGLLLTAASLFAGAGVAIAIGGFISFAILPLLKLLKRLRAMHVEGQLHVGKLLFRTSGMVAVLVGFLFLIPAEINQSAPGIVEYDPPSLLRAPADGFVDKVYVANGQSVAKGDVLIQLRNENLQIELDQLYKSFYQSEQRLRSARWTNDHSLLEEVEADLISYRKQIRELEAQRDALTICAPHDGKVVARTLETMIGTYLTQGDEIGAVGRETAKRIKLSLSVWEASQLKQQQDLSIRVMFPGQKSWLSKLERLETRASLELPDESLAATCGGALAVKNADGEQGPTLIDPRVNAFATLPPEKAEKVRCGQRCAVRLACWRQSLAGLIYEYLSSYV